MSSKTKGHGADARTLLGPRIESESSIPKAPPLSSIMLTVAHMECYPTTVIYCVYTRRF